MKRFLALIDWRGTVRQIRALAYLAVYWLATQSIHSHCDHAPEAARPTEERNER